MPLRAFLRYVLCGRILTDRNVTSDVIHITRDMFRSFVETYSRQDCVYIKDSHEVQHYALVKTRPGKENLHLNESEPQFKYNDILI